MAYYIADWLDQEIFVDITCDEGTDVSELPTHFCPGSTATVGGINAKKYILSASYTWEELPSSGGDQSESGEPAFTEKLQDYAYKMDYPTLDYDNAYAYFKSGGDLVSAACSTLRSGDMVGRNLDWFYSNMADMVIRTPHTEEYKAVIGTAGAVAELTEEFMQSGEKSDAYKIAPFKLQDGVNEDGLFACYNVVPKDYGENVTIPTDTQEVEINALMLVRFVLDRFSTAIEAATYIRKHCKVYFPTALHDLGYELHLFLADSTSSYVVEFIENVAEVIDVTDTPYITNFFRYGVTLNADNTVMTPATGDAIDVNGITEYGAGLERHNVIANGIDDVTDKASMREMLDELKYTRMYITSPDYAEPAWLTEYVGGDLKVNSVVSAFDDIIAASGEMFEERDRDNPLTWQTTHSVIYDIANKTMSISFQEDSVEYGFDVSGNRLPKLTEGVFTQSGTYTPPTGYDGFSSVTITI